ncbi:MAG: TolB-like 6-bladed beta-propeller domain-containing protein [Tannerellaceae bacterium]|nr:TolB-like 6-bladed beta-propeller domain-containing protein [Tannerellaceae bacterium]
MRFFLYLLLISSLFSCNRSISPEFSNYKYFPEEKELQGEIISLDTIFLRYPFRIKVKDSVGIIMDYHNFDHFYHAISYPGGKHLTSFGIIGEAPGEMLSCENMTFLSIDSIWVLDPNKNQIGLWGLSEEKFQPSLKEIIHLDQSIGYPLNFQLKDSSFIIPDYQGNSRFIIVAKDGMPLQFISSIPTKKHKNIRSNAALAQAWRSFISYHPQKEILVLVTQLGEVIEIYNLKDNTRKVIYGPNKEPAFQLLENKGIPTGIMGFLDVQITDQYIYTVFDGQTFKDINKAVMEGKRLPSGGKNIYVFDHEGNPVRKYILDQYVSGIDVHEEERIIFATDVNSNEPILQFRF